MNVCPKECEDDRTTIKSQILEIKKDIKDLFILSIPPWIRGLFVAGIIALFVLYGGQWFFNVTTFVTKKELDSVKVDLKQDIAQGFELLQAKLQKAK